MNSPDLTQRPPRSPRVRLGGFAHLPRLIDKARAQLAGKTGVYVYGGDSLLDRQFFAFTGLTPEAFLNKVSEGGGDQAILHWVLATAPKPLPEYAVEAWSRWLESHPGLSREARAWFAEFSSQTTPPREDVKTLFEYLDLDDYIRFGGTP